MQHLAKLKSDYVGTVPELFKILPESEEIGQIFVH